MNVFDSLIQLKNYIDLKNMQIIEVIKIILYFVFIPIGTVIIIFNYIR